LKPRLKVVDENLNIAFPGEHNAWARERLRIAAYRHLAFLVVEILMLFSGRMKRFVLRNVDVRGLEHWNEAKRQGRGVVILASHVGNWEIMAAAGGMLGMDILMVTKHLKPEWLHRAIEKGRARCGVRATYEPRTFRDVLAHLKRNGTVGFVLDQYAGAPVGVRVPVFGVPVGTHTALALLVKRTQAVVLPVVNYRTNDGRVVIEVEPPVEWIPDDDANVEVALNTARFAATLERHIRAHADQWLWIHRRFKGDLSPLRKDEWREGRLRR
jgi:KDO2-lipid IV(A) lauroyltransferase